MTDSLKQLDQIENDLKYFKKLEDFYNENNPEPEPKNPTDLKVSAFVFVDKPSLGKLQWRIGIVRDEIYGKLDKLIDKQQKIINKLKHKK